MEKKIKKDITQARPGSIIAFHPSLLYGSWANYGNFEHRAIYIILGYHQDDEGLLPNPPPAILKQLIKGTSPEYATHMYGGKRQLQQYVDTQPLIIHLVYLPMDFYLSMATLGHCSINHYHAEVQMELNILYPYEWTELTIQ